MPQTILASILTPSQTSKLPIWTSLNKCPKPSWQALRPPSLTGNAYLNLETISGVLPLHWLVCINNLRKMNFSGLHGIPTVSIFRVWSFLGGGAAENWSSVRSEHQAAVAAKQPLSAGSITITITILLMVMVMEHQAEGRSSRTTTFRWIQSYLST